MKPATYKRLFKKYGLTPRRGYYLYEGYNDKGKLECRACAIGFRFVHALKSREAVGDPNKVNYSAMMSKLCEDECMPEGFARGLDSGWESCNGINYMEGIDKDFDAGFIEGRAAALAILGE